jgi:hypothetical protein
MLDSAGVPATSFKPGDKVYISSEKVLPLERFLPKPKIPGGKCTTMFLYVDGRLASDTNSNLLS